MTKVKQRTAKVIECGGIQHNKFKKKLKSSNLKSKQQTKANKNNRKAKALTSSKASTQAYSDISGTTTPSIKSKEDFLQYYQSEEKKTLQVYGHDILKYGESLEQNESISSDFLDRHNCSIELRVIVLQYISDLLIKVKVEDHTFFLTVFVLDSYLNKTNDTVNENDFYLIAFTSLYIASKMESLQPFTIADVINLCQATIGREYTESEVFEKEKTIINSLNFNLISFSSYDFMKTFMCDFKVNNAERIEKMKAEKYIDLLETKCTDILKVISMRVQFYQYNSSLIAIAALIVAFDILKSQKKFTEEILHCLYTYINSLINLSGDSKDTIIKIYTEINEC